jgi:hypothetical protein
MTETKSVVQALACVAADVRSVRKNSQNTAQKFNFRGIDAVMNAVGPAFREHGVICVPVTENVSIEPMPLASGKNASRCIVQVRYEFHGPAGDSINAIVCGESFDMGDKALAKAYSVALRTCLLQTLCIPTDEPDPDETTYDAAPIARAAAKPKPKPKASSVVSERIDSLHARLAGIPDSKLQEYGVWRVQHQIPKLSENLTEEQCTLIDGWLIGEGF